MLSDLAAVYGWSPTELWDLDLADIPLWHERAKQRVEVSRV